MEGNLILDQHSALASVCSTERVRPVLPFDQQRAIENQVWIQRESTGLLAGWIPQGIHCILNLMMRSNASQTHAIKSNGVHQQNVIKLTRILINSMDCIDNKLIDIKMNGG